MFDLRKIREQAHVNQNDLAEKVGVSRQAISMYENDQIKPTVSNAKKIAKILNFDWSLFYEENNSED